MSFRLNANNNTLNSYCGSWLWDLVQLNRPGNKWLIHFEQCTILHHVLRSDNYGFSRGFCSLFTGWGNDHHTLSLLEKLRQDKTIINASNTLHSSIMNYLWNGRGDTVHISTMPDIPNSFSTEQLKNAESSLQRSINNNFVFNQAISSAVKNAIDYGAGYIVADKGLFTNAHPMYVAFGQTPNEQAKYYILDKGAYYWIFGKKGELSDLLGIKTNKKYFAAKYPAVGKKTNNMGLKEDDVPMIFQFELPYYRDCGDIPVGCGTSSIEAVEKAAALADDALFAQRSELRPLTLVSASGRGPEEFENIPGKNVYYNNTLVNAAEVARPAFSPRAANSHSFLETWRQDIRRNYLLDQLVARGVGQTTAIDAARNAQASSSIFHLLNNSFFSGFMSPLLLHFVKHKKNALPSSVKEKINKSVQFSYFGDFANGELDKSLVLMQKIFGITTNLANIDPKILLLLEPKNIAKKIYRNTLPSSFFKNENEFEEAIGEQENIALAQQQALANRGVQDAQ